MRQVLDKDEAKRDWLLTALISHYPEIVDNLTTKDNLTYSQLKIRLNSCSSNAKAANINNSALVTNHDSHKKQKSRTSTNTNTASTAPTNDRISKCMHLV